MMNPIRASVGWLTGRLLVFLVIIAALVVWDAYRDESRFVAAAFKGYLPDEELLERLTSSHESLKQFAAKLEREVNDRSAQLGNKSAAAIDERIVTLDAEIKSLERQRLLPWKKAVAIATGDGIQDALKNEIEIQLLTAEQESLKRFRGQIAAIKAKLAGAEERVRHAGGKAREDCAAYKTEKSKRDQYRDEHPWATRVPGTTASQNLQQLVNVARDAAERCVLSEREWRDAKANLAIAKKAPQGHMEQVQSASREILEPLATLIEQKRSVVDAADKHANRIKRSIGHVFLKALGILVLVTVAPVGIKAFWYYLMAPLAARRAPIRFSPWNSPNPTPSAEPWLLPLSSPRASAVSQEVRLESGEELLVHPEFLQSLAERGERRTKWLLDWSIPLSSIASHMVALTRIEAPGESFVISSKNDPLAEVGVIELAAGTAVVLQPRSLVGIVQPVGRPIRIRREWRFGIGAFITLQFRYLIFEGPGKLIVQGCRGIRVERAGSGRSIDQNSMIGFSANLDYAPRRSETFGAYMLGVNGLFNDSFAGGTGYYIYEEMPYFGKRSGLTGRGLEGLTDGLMKVFGI